MKGIVSTEQIYFRPISVHDIDNGWLDWINNPISNKFLIYKKPSTYEDLVKYLEKSQPPSVYMFAVCLVDTDEYIGNARLSSIDWVNRNASYGRLLGNSDLRGRGIGPEILVLLAYYAFFNLNLHRISTGVVANNIASIKSNEKAGAVREGLSREASYIDGVYEDLMMFGITKKDFEKTKWNNIVLT